MAHPSTEIRNALHTVLGTIVGLPSKLYRERVLADIEDDLPVLSVGLGDTSVEIANESPREERRKVEALIAVKTKAATGQAVMEATEAYADLIERALLAAENLGLSYVERVEYTGLSQAKDGEGARIFGVHVLTFSVTYIWDYPELSHDDFDTIAGGIDHNEDVSDIETPIEIDLTNP